MNLIEQIAQLLGVEMGQKFCVYSMKTGNTTKKQYYFDVDGLREVNGGKKINVYVFNELITGKFMVAAPVYTPTLGDTYYYVDVDSTIKETVWSNSIMDYSLFNLKNCFVTPENINSYMITSLVEKMTKKYTNVTTSPSDSPSDETENESSTDIPTDDTTSGSEEDKDDTETTTPTDEESIS